jgi:hypothetical protein
MILTWGKGCEELLSKVVIILQQENFVFSGVLKYVWRKVIPFLKWSTLKRGAP